MWTLYFAFGLTSAGRHGDINDRIPLPHHQRALIMTSTIFGKNAYDDGIRDAIGTVTDDWAFRLSGIADVEHIYFYAATSATPELVQPYFQQAYQIGRDFKRPARVPGRPPRPPDHPPAQMSPRLVLVRRRTRAGGQARMSTDEQRRLTRMHAGRYPGRRSFERGHRALVPPKAATDAG